MRFQERKEPFSWDEKIPKEYNNNLDEYFKDCNDKEIIITKNDLKKSYEKIKKILLD